MWSVSDVPPARTQSSIGQPGPAHEGCQANRSIRLYLKYFEGDWRGYESLSLRLYNPETEPLRIICRIHDLAHEAGHQGYHDRFNRRFLLQPGWNDLKIELAGVIVAPQSRRMDLAQITNLGLFGLALQRPRTLLDEVRLNR